MSYLNYSTYVNTLATLTIISSNDVNFQNILPSCINYAEQRILRELDLLNAKITDIATVSSNNRLLTYPSNIGTFLVVDQINMFTPAGSSATTGIRVPLQVVSREYISTVYPSDATSIGTPSVFAIRDDNMAIIGPVPDQTYYFELVGTQRIVPLSVSNSTTFLTSVAPDLFIAASMVYMTGYMKNWGAQGDDPKMAISWENQYQMLLKSANEEEMRKKFWSEGWQSQEQAAIATPKRV